MKIIFSRQDNTYIYFFVTSFCILVYAIATLLMYGDSTLIINVTGRNIPLNHFEISILFKIAYLVLALGYFVAQRLRFNLNPSLTKAHTWITIGTVFINALVMITLPRPLAENISLWLIGITLLAQPLFFINLAIGISKRER